MQTRPGFNASSTRVGAIRRTDSGEWITERQNDAAERSDTAIPSPPPQGKLRSLLTKLDGEADSSVAERIQSATADELFELIDRDLGGS